MYGMGVGMGVAGARLASYAPGASPLRASANASPNDVIGR